MYIHILDDDDHDDDHDDYDGYKNQHFLIFNIIN